MPVHRIDSVGACLRFTELPGASPRVVFLTGMGLAAAETFLPAVPKPLRGRRLLFVELADADGERSSAPASA